MYPSGFPDPYLVDHAPLLFIDLLTPRLAEAMLPDLHDQAALATGVR
jgi:hypothetical protein